MVLPILAAGLCADREPGAPWVRFQKPGQNPVFVDPTSVRDDSGEKVIRLLDTSEGPSTSDIWIDVSFACAARRAWMIRLTEVVDGKPGKVIDIPPAERKPMKLDDPMGRRLFGFVCKGKKL
ncbi:hypothetical protein M9978_21390 [Sphingomonas sp. MG17]|uniref:Uncharacterized protein n=1 Tax=Sphingomonas tagetis TaxID=2949092 RepID=A0A9X2HPC3_9SPHN|nr:hypothetical protein [Sphingomonas tagetis]MCP3732974.1 hypothetical protein [Sphingomonas tagetis]